VPARRNFPAICRDQEQLLATLVIKKKNNALSIKALAFSEFLSLFIYLLLLYYYINKAAAANQSIKLSNSTATKSAGTASEVREADQSVSQ
jgi:hypothetical protein